MQDTVAALVVTYFPDAALPERIDRLLAQFDRVAVIDNGSDDAALESLKQYEARITLHRNPSNLGIATALNQGLRILAAEDFKWVVTFDQDSSIRPNFLSSMLETLNAAPDRERVALIGANRIDPDNAIDHRWLRPRRGFPFFERVTCEETSSGVTLVITSGTLTSVAAFEELGGFRDELFIDMVDFDYCLSAREHGYKILVSCRAELVHRVGEQTKRAVGGLLVSSSHHCPQRRYYLFRNSIHLIRQHGRAQPHWLFYQLLALGEIVLGIIVSETDKARKLGACLTGLIDGLAGRKGRSIRDWNEPSSSAAAVHA